MQRILFILLAIASVGAGVMFYHYNQADFVTLDNNKYTFKQLKGDYIVINYFAEWCAPCLKEVPELSDFNESKPDNVHLFAVSYDNVSAEKLTELKSKYDMRFSLIKELKVDLPFQRPSFLPATFILNGEGQVAKELFGEVSSEQLQSIIRDLNDA